MNARIALPVAVLGIVGTITFTVWAADSRTPAEPGTQAAPKQQADSKGLAVQGDSELFEGVPGAAAAALTMLAGPGSFESVERQRTGSVEVYMATWKLNGHAHDATVSADGVLIEGNERVDAVQAPPPVQRVAGEFYGREAQIEYRKKTIVVYSARAPLRGHQHEIIISPTGELADDGGADETATQPASDVPTTAPAMTQRR